MRIPRLPLLMIPLALGCGSKSPDSTSKTILPDPGQTWWVDDSEVEVVEPSGANSLLILIQGRYPLFMSAIDVTDSDFGMLFALANEDGTQDVCSRTIVMNGINAGKNGQFTYGPEDFALANGVLTESLVLSGRFSDDLGTVSDIVLKGSIRLSTIPEDMLPLGGTDACDMVASLNIPCEACRDGSVDCLTIHTVGLAGDLREGVTVDVIDEPDGFEECVEDTGSADADAD